MDIFKKLTLASIGALELTKEKLEEIFDEMVKRGEMTDNERAAAVRNFMERSSEGADKFRLKVEEIFARCAEKCSSTVSSRQAELEKRLGSLAGKIEELEKKIGKK